MTIAVTPIPLRALPVLDGRVMVTPVMFVQPPYAIQRKPSLESAKLGLRRLFCTRHMANPEGVHYRCVPAIGFPSLPK